MQDAHEAIRPTSINRRPEDIKEYLTNDEYKLYKLIYYRALASLMKDAKVEVTTITLDNNDYKFNASGTVLKFDGYLRVYNDNEEEDNILPDLSNTETIISDSIDYTMHTTKPPARYTESSLVDAMENKGIGRPATYTQTVSVLYARNYIEKDKGKAIKSTELGRTAVDYLVKHVENIMDIGFTADMENKLDDIEYMGKDWKQVVSEFYGPFENELKKAVSSGDNAKVPDEESDVVCDKCGTKMVIRAGKFGKFLACPNFPKCKNTKPLEEEKPVVAKCPKCGKNVRQLKSKKGKMFYGCEGYPECDYISWDMPAGEDCPNCKEHMIVKIYSKNKITSCPKCGFSKKEPIKVESQENGEQNS